MEENKLEQIFAAIDEVNGQDPNTIVWEEETYPKEVLYGWQMSAWLEDICETPSIALQIAVRAQHIARWESARNSYPMDRVGYLRWRSDLKKHHAEKVGDILQSLGEDTELIERVQFLIQKKKLSTDTETQTLEDVACLVFLEFYFADFAPDYDEEKVITILQKTWKKMSPLGHEHALQIEMSDYATELVKKALK